MNGAESARMRQPKRLQTVNLSVHLTHALTRAARTMDGSG